MSQAKAAFKGLALEIDASVDNKIDVLAKMIKIKLNNGCQRPLKILMTGRKSQAEVDFRDSLASTFGLNVIDLENLMMTHVKNKTYFGNLIVELKQSSSEIPSNILVDIIMDRVEKVDCQVKGFLLDICDRKIQLARSIESMQLYFHLAVKVDETPSDEEDIGSAITLKYEKVISVDTGRSFGDYINKIFFEITHFYDEEAKIDSS